MQTRNPFLDEFAKLATGAAGVAQSMGEEARAFWRSQIERIIADMDLVRRDEFDAVKEMAATARAEADAAKVRLDALEATLARAGVKKTPSTTEAAPKATTSRKKTV